MKKCRRDCSILYEFGVCSLMSSVYLILQALEGYGGVFGDLQSERATHARTTHTEGAISRAMTEIPVSSMR